MNMSVTSISRFEDALAFVKRSQASEIFFRTWIPKSRFVELLHDENGFSFSRADNNLYAFAFGAKPPIREEWGEFSIERGAAQISQIEAKERVDWETYFIDVPQSVSVKEDAQKRSDSEIEEFLKIHAPESSVFPGNKEILDWIRIDNANELVGVAAVCRWESGEHVIASVATHNKIRGLGIGARVMNQALAVARELEISRLCLGVLSDNEPAKALYKKLGWGPLYRFTYLHRD